MKDKEVKQKLIQLIKKYGDKTQLTTIDDKKVNVMELYGVFVDGNKIYSSLTGTEIKTYTSILKNIISCIEQEEMFLDKANKLLKRK